MSAIEFHGSETGVIHPIFAAELLPDGRWACFDLFPVPGLPMQRHPRAFCASYEDALDEARSAGCDRVTTIVALGNDRYRAFPKLLYERSYPSCSKSA